MLAARLQSVRRHLRRPRNRVIELRDVGTPLSVGCEVCGLCLRTGSKTRFLTCGTLYGHTEGMLALPAQARDAGAPVNTSTTPTVPRTEPIETDQSPSARRRRPELDWLRTLIVLSIIPYHALLLFVTGGASIIKHPITTPLAPVVYNAVDVWGISLIFLLAGAASRFALDVRPPHAYVTERLLRLGVPALLVILFLAPLQAFFLLLQDPHLASVSPRPIAHPEQLRHLGVFFVQYWTSLFTTGSPIVVRNLLAHLWFVPRLLIVSLVCLPLFLLLMRKWPNWSQRVATSRLSAGVLVLIAGLVPAVVYTVLLPGWLNRLSSFSPVTDDWTIFFLDLIMFVYGYLLYSGPQFLGAVRRLAYTTLVAAALLWAVILPMKLLGIVPNRPYSPQYVLFAVSQVCATWMLSLGVLGLALRYLTKAPSWQRYLTAATFPVYVLHLPLLIISAYYVQELPVPWFVQLGLIIIVSVTGAFALYEFVIRRTRVTRLLFGLESPRTSQASDSTRSPHLPAGSAAPTRPL